MSMPNQFDRAKMRAVILRAIHACAAEDLGAVKLNKVLYFVDMIHYAHFRQPVTGATYRKRPAGPTTDQLLFLLRDLEREGDVEVNEVDFYGFRKKEYHALKPEPAGVLNDVERSLVDEVVEFVCKQNSARSISEYSHQAPWELAEDGGEIPYVTALLLFPNHVSPEAFEVAGAGVDEIEASKSGGRPVVVRDIRAFRESILAQLGQAGS